jgi:membrane fusion protein
MEKEKPQNDSAANQEGGKKKDIPLFRQEALQHKKGSYLGKAIIASPISFSLWAWGIFIIAVALGLFLYFGKYAKRQEVIGMLVPNKGLIHVYANAQGIVVNRYVQQGDKVTKGQLLYLISTERHTLSDQGAYAQQAELLEKQIALLKNRLALYEKNLSRYKQLLAERFVSEEEYQKYYDNYLSVEVSLRETEQKLVQAKGGGDYALRASDDGVISTLVAMVGDRVTENKPLVTIVPRGAVLQGVLFVRSDAIGFVKIGQKVLLKYDAYPYQNFGLYESTIESIDKSILFPKDIELQLNINPYVSSSAAAYGSNEPFYRVIVALKQQTVMVYGKPYPLTPGMTLRGSMIGDERHIWQWVLYPIYSLRGSLIAP